MPFIIVILTLLAAVLFGLRLWNKRETRQKLLVTPLTDRQRSLILENAPMFRRTPVELRRKIEGKINLFLHQVEFIGCNGLEVSEEMELTIAAKACLLIANKNMWYDTLRTILIYPDAFKSRAIQHDGHVVSERETIRIGESWTRGPVVLSWFHSAQGALIDDDGHNVVLHEFAHQLDSMSGYPDGFPLLGSQFTDWQHVLAEAYERLILNVEAGRETFLNAYGATAPEEFFAVAVEVFFERPIDLKHEEPAVYAQLSEFFDLDPSSWETQKSSKLNMNS